MSGTYKSGFTLLEVVVAIALIALMATIVIPQLWQKKPAYERQQFIAHLNGLMQYAAYHAMQEQKVHKITFDFAKQSIFVEVETVKRDSEGNPEFKLVRRAYQKTSLAWLKQLQVRQFFIEEFDEMTRFGGGRSTQKVWIFIVPQGLAQTVKIMCIDTKDVINKSKPRPVPLILNPFTVQFREEKTGT